MLMLLKRERRSEREDGSNPRKIEPVIAEPLFQQLDSTVQFIPVMNGDDLQRGLIETAG
jgi:hypothetical protein